MSVVLLDDRDPHVVSRDNNGAGSADEQEDDDDVVHYYDRSKSFFDNISCESSERAKGWVIIVVTAVFLCRGADRSDASW